MTLANVNSRQTAQVAIHRNYTEYITICRNQVCRLTRGVAAPTRGPIQMNSKFDKHKVAGSPTRFRTQQAPAVLRDHGGERAMKSIALLFLLHAGACQAMCYIVEDLAGKTLYMAEQPPVNMAADSPSKEVQVKYPGGHMTIVTYCPPTPDQMEIRRLLAILEVQSATALRDAQARAPAAVSTYFPPEKPQPVFYAGTISQNDYGLGGYGYSGGYYGGYYGGRYPRPVGGYNPQGPHVGHYGSRTR